MSTSSSRYSRRTYRDQYRRRYATPGRPVRILDPKPPLPLPLSLEND